MKRTSRIFFCLAIFSIIVYILGPKPETPVYDLELPTLNKNTDADRFVAQIESKHPIRPGNHAEIIWNSHAGDSTEYSLVYLHGFSASKEEGNPLHLQTAKSLNANVYLSRLAHHGLDTVDKMIYFTAEQYWESGKQALAIGKKLGRKVILMGTSNGGALAMQLAAAFPNDVYALILLSPNIEINQKGVFLLNKPWGLQLARGMVGGKERIVDGKSETYKKYWYTNYRLESLVALQNYVESTMNVKTFRQIRQPTLMLYYYKNKEEQDNVVKVDAMLKMFNKLGTPSTSKFKKAIPEAAEHVISSYVTSKDLVTPQKEINKFVQFIKMK